MPIKNLFGRGIGYSPGGRGPLFRHGLDYDPVASPLTGTGYLKKKVGSSALLKIGDHLTNDASCCCSSWEDANCETYTNVRIDGQSVDVEFDTESSPPPWCPSCDSFGGTYSLTPSCGYCYCGGRTQVDFDGYCNPDIYPYLGYSRVDICAELSKDTPFTPSATCWYPNQSGGSTPGGCLFNHAVYDPGPYPNVRWYANVAYLQPRAHPNPPVCYNSIWYSIPIPWDSGGYWPILGTWNLAPVTYDPPYSQGTLCTCNAAKTPATSGFGPCIISSVSLTVTGEYVP